MAFPKIEGYVVTEKLGSGSYSTVYKAYTKVGTRSVVAVKCVDKSRVRHSSAAVDSLVTEIRLLKTLTHPHIVTMSNFTWDTRNIYIIMEFCNGGDLSKYIRRYGRIPEAQVLYFLQQLASALRFLREKEVAHMDLKPHNLLLNKDADGKYTLKVGDFGLAQHLQLEGAGVRGSPLYMAPEVLLQARYDARADLWSVGVIMYECLFGRAPFSGSSLPELVEKMQKKIPIELPPGSGVSPGCRDLLTRLLTHDPDCRITHEQFFHHEYLDLEHMPSKENYEKAVSLISLAISQESAGDLRGALKSYTSALRYLVPAVRAEPRAPRRHALRAKLERYMERAEEIKQYLNDPDSVLLTPPVSSTVTTTAVTTTTVMTNGVMTTGVSGGSRRSIACCGNTNVLKSGHYYEPAAMTHIYQEENPVLPQDSNNTSNDHVKVSSHDTVKSTSHDSVKESGRDSGKDSGRDSGKDSCRDSGKEAGSVKRTFRLFRRTAVPLLTAQDSSIVNAEEATEQKTSEETNDGCRIT